MERAGENEIKKGKPPPPPSPQGGWKRASGKNQAYVYFDSPFTGLASIRFRKSGEIGSEPLSLIVNDKRADAIEVELVGGQREYVVVTFSDKSVDFAIEAEAHESNS